MLRTNQFLSRSRTQYVSVDKNQRIDLEVILRADRTSVLAQVPGERKNGQKMRDPGNEVEKPHPGVKNFSLFHMIYCFLNRATGKESAL